MGQLSHRVELPFPLFDADNHLYEPPEALTKYLPKEYKDVVQYVQVNGRTKIAVKGQISNYIPNPTFEVVARPGAVGGVLQVRQPGGQEQARAVRRAHALDPGVLRAGAAAGADGPARRRPHPDVPDAGQPPRGAAA
ncbi:amidohydrolase family domain protein [Mycolicibacterium hassiacum DSM 44199]|uniref:Amidohydrolase family domain protein n=1 Tax=Mycolicibacterium hassiacum (strain DSM 44199 / CIP 105218 / JCM 12690 / 3849) TaxID=1122247 RepID=K5BAV6_MYCHD|nr:amidohydrolase family domain protein [Mycolicibacterium hassiacum DSM 44199]